MKILRWIGLPWCVLVSGAAAYMAVTIRHKLWVACEPPGNSGAADRIYTLFILLPVTTVVTFVVVGGTYWFVVRRGPRVAPTAPIIALLAGCLMCYLAVVVDYNPAEMTEIWCRGGKPSWWPSWLPL
ncbi:hypothetical protein GCM10009624_06920 [Gordonia sinesedis]